MTLFELQLVWSGTANDLWFELEMALCFLDITLQQPQFLVPHPAEWPPRFGVIVILIWSVLFCGAVQSFNFARTILSPRFLSLFRLRHGFGTISASVWSGFRISLRRSASRSAVCLITKNVSYRHGSLSLSSIACPLEEKGTEFATWDIRFVG